MDPISGKAMVTLEGCRRGSVCTVHSNSPVKWCNLAGALQLSSADCRCEFSAKWHRALGKVESVSGHGEGRERLFRPGRGQRWWCRPVPYLSIHLGPENPTQMCVNNSASADSSSPIGLEISPYPKETSCIQKSLVGAGYSKRQYTPLVPVQIRIWLQQACVNQP